MNDIKNVMRGLYRYITRTFSVSRYQLNEQLQLSSKTLAFCFDKGYTGGITQRLRFALLSHCCPHLCHSGDNFH